MYNKSSWYTIPLSRVMVHTCFPVILTHTRWKGLGGLSVQILSCRAHKTEGNELKLWSHPLWFLHFLLMLQKTCQNWACACTQAKLLSFRKLITVLYMPGFEMCLQLSFIFYYKKWCKVHVRVPFFFKIMPPLWLLSKLKCEMAPLSHGSKDL